MLLACILGRPGLDDTLQRPQEEAVLWDKNVGRANGRKIGGLRQVARDASMSITVYLQIQDQ
jgi:hypothetical protein